MNSLKLTMNKKYFKRFGVGNKKYQTQVVSKYDSGISKVENVLYPSGNVITIHYLPNGIVDKMYLNNKKIL